MPHGLIPPVVMEFPGITAGGGFSGTSGESSSFRNGFFSDCVNWIELVLGDGEVTRASPVDGPYGEKADLFHGAAGAVGTLGVVTLLELRLVQAKRYVETTFWPVTSVDEAVSKMQDAMAQPEDEVEYLDGILYSRTQGVIITGKLVDTPTTPNTNSDRPPPIQTFGNASDPWFYLYAQSHAPAPTPTTILIPTADYLLRYDRGGFWVGTSAFEYFAPVVPFNRLTRWLVDDFMHTRMLYAALHKSGHDRQYVVQDCVVPWENAGEFVHYADEAFGIWPLWLCPLKRPEPWTEPPQPGGGAREPETGGAAAGPDTEGKQGLRTFHPHILPLPSRLPPQQPNYISKSPSSPSSSSSSSSSSSNTTMLNIGLWGPGPIDPAAFFALNRHLELTLRRLRGMKWGYSHHYYPRDDFWAMYDEGWYRALRGKYGARGLPDVWEKISVRVPGEEGGSVEAKAGGGGGGGGEGEDQTNSNSGGGGGGKKKTAATTTGPIGTEGQRPKTWRQSLLELWPFEGLYGVYGAMRSGVYVEDRKGSAEGGWRRFAREWPFSSSSSSSSTITGVFGRAEGRTEIMKGEEGEGKKEV